MPIDTDSLSVKTGLSSSELVSLMDECHTFLNAPVSSIFYSHWGRKKPHWHTSLSATLQALLSCLSNGALSHTNPWSLARKYSPMQRAKQLADEVKEQVKALGCPRHKIVVQVRVSLICHTLASSTSRCRYRRASILFNQRTNDTFCLPCYVVPGIE